MINKATRALTPYSTHYKPKQKETEMWVYVVRGILSPFIFIAWLAYYKQKNEINSNEIKDLQESNERKTLTIKSLQGQIKTIKQQNSKPELVAEQTKRLVKNGDIVRLEETKVCEGNFNTLNQFFSSGGW